MNTGKAWRKIWPIFLMIVTCLSACGDCSGDPQGTQKASTTAPFEQFSATSKSDAIENAGGESAPEEFESGKWYISPNPAFTYESLDLKALASVTWYFNGGALRFSEQGHFAFGSPWTGIECYGGFSIDGTTVSFSPALRLRRWDEPFAVEKLVFSRERFLYGSPALINADITIVFTPPSAKRPEKGETSIIDGYEIITMDRKASVAANGFLFALPNRKSKNLFAGIYYGERAKGKIANIRGELKLDGQTWYFALLDFTEGAAVDGGGPYYEGWLPAEMLIDLR